jgi:hypothetical protein
VSGSSVMKGKEVIFDFVGTGSPTRLSREEPLPYLTRRLEIQARVAAAQEKQLRSGLAYRVGRIALGLSGGSRKAIRAIGDILPLFPGLFPNLVGRFLHRREVPAANRRWLSELVRVAHPPVPEIRELPVSQQRGASLKAFEDAWSNMHRAVASYLQCRESDIRRFGLHLFERLLKDGVRGLLTFRGTLTMRKHLTSPAGPAGFTTAAVRSADPAAPSSSVPAAPSSSAPAVEARSAERLLRVLRKSSPWRPLSGRDGRPLRIVYSGGGWLAHALAYDAEVWWLGKEAKAGTISGMKPDLLLFASPPSDQLSGSPGRWIRDVEQVIGDPRLKAIPSACWLSETIPGIERLGRLLAQVHRIYVADRTAVSAVSRWLGKEARHLPPAIQPPVHNPLGWWEDGFRDPQWLARPTALWERRHPTPGPIWDAIVTMGRGVDITRNEAGNAARALGESPPRLDAIPPWTKKIEGGTLRDRFLRMRRVHKRHTFRSRLLTLARDAGLGAKLGIEEREPVVSVLLCTRRPHRLRRAVHAVRRQTYPRIELVLLLHGPGFSDKEISKATGGLADLRVFRAPEEWNLGRLLRKATELATGEIFARMDDDDMYGDEYVADQVRALRFSGASLVGKLTNAICFPDDGILALRFPGMEFLFVEPFGGASFAGLTAVIREVGWKMLPRHEDTALGMDLQSLGIPLLSTDRFNAVQVRSKNPKLHACPFPAGRYLAGSRRLPPSARPEDLYL